MKKVFKFLDKLAPFGDSRDPMFLLLFIIVNSIWLFLLVALVFTIFGIDVPYIWEW